MAFISKKYKVENGNMGKYQKLSEVDFYVSGYKRCVVFGNGISVKEYVKQPGDFTIGVNDICKFMTPNILLIVDTRLQFRDPERIAEIENTDCIHVIRDEGWNFKKGSTYLFSLGSKGSFSNFKKPDVIDTGWDSPYMACLLAGKIGFKKIDLIGVDYTDNHFYKEDGPHNLMHRFKEVNSFYGKLKEFFDSQHIDFHNLSKTSKLTTVPKYI